MRCLQAARCRGRLSVRRLRTSRLLGTRTVSIRGRRQKTFTVKLRRARLGAGRRWVPISSPAATRGEREAQGDPPRDAAPPLSDPASASA